MINVIIADDHAVVRKGLRQILEDTTDIKIKDEAVNGSELLEKLKNGKFDVVILDVSLPDMNGLEVLKEIKNLYPSQKVLIFTIYPEDQYAIRLLKSGASGYVNKNSDPEVLINAVRSIAVGRKYISPDLAELLASSLDSNSTRPPHEVLSDREFQVLCMIASGNSVGDIAKKLKLSSNTISTYRNRIMEKLDLKNNSEITYYAFRYDLVS